LIKKLLIILTIIPLITFSCKSETETKIDVETKTGEHAHTEGDEHKEGEAHEEAGEHKEGEAGHDEHGEEHAEGVIELTTKDVKNLQLKIAPAQEREMPEYLKTAGEIEENENFTTHVSSRLNGRVLSINKGIGEYVSKGDTLAVIENKDIAGLQSEILQTRSRIAILEQEAASERKLLAANQAQQQKMIDFSRQAYNRQKKLFAEDIAPRKNVEEADKNLKTAILEKEKIRLEGEQEQQRIRGEINTHRIELQKVANELQVYNFSAGQISQMIASGKLNTSVSIFAPVNGLVSEKHISLGEMIDTEKEIFTIINPSAVWIFANVYEKDIDKIEIGQKAYFLTRSADKSRYNAVVNYIPPAVTHETRTAKVRLSLTTPATGLRKGMYADVFINTGSSDPVTVVPKEAVQRDENQTVVYLRKDEKTYQKTPVITGRSDEKYIEVKSGLKKGDTVATKGSFTLKAMSKTGEMGHHDH
jgi:cobalt-zinc-cadmium efflux system membrane fusion protein